MRMRSLCTASQCLPIQIITCMVKHVSGGQGSLRLLMRRGATNSHSKEAGDLSCSSDQHYICCRRTKQGCEAEQAAPGSLQTIGTMAFLHGTVSVEASSNKVPSACLRSCLSSKGSCEKIRVHNSIGIWVHRSSSWQGS